MDQLDEMMRAINVTRSELAQIGAMIVDEMCPQYIKIRADERLRQVFRGCIQWVDTVCASTASIRYIAPFIEIIRRTFSKREVMLPLLGTPPDISHSEVVLDLHRYIQKYWYVRDLSSSAKACVDYLIKFRDSLVFHTWASSGTASFQEPPLALVHGFATFATNAVGPTCVDETAVPMAGAYINELDDTIVRLRAAHAKGFIGKRMAEFGIDAVLNVRYAMLKWVLEGPSEGIRDMFLTWGGCPFDEAPVKISTYRLDVM